MSVRKKLKLVHEGKYVAEVEVDPIDDDTGWAPYISIDDAKKMDAVRAALRGGRIDEASTYGRVFELQPVAARETA